MHRTPIHRTLFGALAVCLALLVSACGASGGSDDADKDDPTTTVADKTTTTEASTTTEPEDDEEGDAEAQARADSIDLTVSDLPDGWESTPATEDEGPSPLDQCKETVGDDAIAEHSTDDFILGDPSADDGVQVSIKTKVFADEAAAEAALEPFTDDVVLACVDDLFQEQFSEVGTIEGEMGTEDFGDTDADQAVAVAGQYTVTTEDGTEIDLVVAVAVLRTGDLATQIQVTGVGPSIQDADLEAVSDRVEELQAEA